MQVVSSQEEFQWLLLIVMGFLLSLLPESFLWMGCLGAVLLIGIPHGALDIYLLWFNDKNEHLSFVKSISQYILMVLGGLILWRLFPELFWGGFFLAATYHFGSSDEHPEVMAAIASQSMYRIVWILSRGTVLVFAPAAFHPAKMASYLSQAAPSSFATQICEVAPFLCAYAGIFFVWATYQCWKRSHLQSYRLILIKHLVSLLLLLGLFMVAEPLLSFSLYFCCHHSLTHSFRVVGKIRRRTQGAYLVLWAGLITLGVLPILLWVSKRMSMSHLSESWVTASFVTIAALTFPHLIVVKTLHERLRKRLHSK